MFGLLIRMWMFGQQNVCCAWPACKSHIRRFRALIITFCGILFVNNFIKLAWSIVLSHTHINFHCFHVQIKRMSCRWIAYTYEISSFASSRELNSIFGPISIQKDFVIFAPLLLFSFHREWMTRFLTSTHELINVIDFAFKSNLINCLKNYARHYGSQEKIAKCETNKKKLAI